MSSASASCRSCGAGDLELILSLGNLPLANGLLTSADLDRPEPRYPLDVAFCGDCSLVQLLGTVPPEDLFLDYRYFSSYSETMLRHVRSLAERLLRERRLGERSLVVEVASNDGYLLQYYRQAGVPVLGIEPARNVAEVAERERGIPTLTEFFGETLARSLAADGRRADVIHAHNVLAHVPDLNGFAAGLATLVHDDGLVVVEVPYVRDMVERCEFDTIYHEHLCYFSATALDRLFSKHGLALLELERVAVHGGSLRVLAGKARGDSQPASVAELLDEEAHDGLDRPEFYRSFAARVGALRESIRRLVLGLRATGKRVAAYGAAAKGTVLLNYADLGGAEIDYVVDRSIHKQGRYLPGTRIRVEPPARLLEDSPDFVLLLVWNLADEVLEQQRTFVDGGGRFIVPVPEVRLVPA